MLSQAEVDALLTGLETRADLDQPAASSSRNKLRPRQFRFLKHCHDVLCGELSSAWERLTNSSVSVHLNSIDEFKYETFSRGLGSNCVAVVGDSKRIGQVLVALSTSAACPIVQCMLGSDIARHVAIPQKLTEVELKLASRAISSLVSCYEKSWANGEPVELAVQSVANELPALPITPIGEIVVVVTLGVQVGSYEGECRIVWPLELLNELIPSSERSSSDVALPENLQLSVQLPTFELEADELNDLKIGQLIVTGFGAQNAVEVLVNGEPSFVGTLGALDERKAVRIVDECGMTNDK